MNTKHNERGKPSIHELQFNVAQLLKEATGATRYHDVNTTILSHLNDETALVSPVVGQLKFLRTGSDILVTGSLEVTVQKNCGRCLSTFTRSISVELEEQFYPTIDVVTGAALEFPPDADEANRIGEQHILDMYEVLRQDFLLESDGVLYCRPDCLGLCPHCGRDRNTDPCDCDVDTIDPRWAALRALQAEEE